MQVLLLLLALLGLICLFVSTQRSEGTSPGPVVSGALIVAATFVMCVLLALGTGHEEDVYQPFAPVVVCNGVGCY